MARFVHILAATPGLRAGLRAELASVPGVALEEPNSQAPWAPGDIVIVPVSECSPRRCAEFIATGVTVIVLAEFPNKAERNLYWTTGASAYIPMTPGSTELTDAVIAVTTATAAASG